MAQCPKCNAEVTLAAVENTRNGKWTVVPLDYDENGGNNTFRLDSSVTHATVDIMGNDAGTYSIGMYVPDDPECNYKPHPPSHYVDAHA